MVKSVTSVTRVSTSAASVLMFVSVPCNKIMLSLQVLESSAISAAIRLAADPSAVGSQNY